jgi:5-carboxymethyl-2-hydroxymuconate isomerase
MPHIVVLYTANLDTPSPTPGAEIGPLCRRLADALLAVRDEAGAQVFPTGGVRVLAYPAAHFAVADGRTPGTVDAGFVYIQLRMGRGRSDAVKQRTGDALRASAAAHFAPLLAARAVGITLQIDEGPGVYDAKLGNLHPFFSKVK